MCEQDQNENEQSQEQQDYPFFILPMSVDQALELNEQGRGNEVSEERWLEL